MQFKARWYVNTKTTSEQSFCFCTFFSKSALETECTLLISGFTFLLKYPLFSNHDSNSLNLLFKFPSSEQILFYQVKSSQLYFRHKNLQLQNIQFSNTEINIEIKTATAVIKNELKYFPMSEGNACIAEPNLEALPLIWFSKGLV